MTMTAMTMTTTMMLTTTMMMMTTTKTALTTTNRRHPASARPFRRRALPTPATVRPALPCEAGRSHARRPRWARHAHGARAAQIVPSLRVVRIARVARLARIARVAPLASARAVASTTAATPSQAWRRGRAVQAAPAVLQDELARALERAARVVLVLVRAAAVTARRAQAHPSRRADTSGS
jgi:hypothetical protein